MSTQLDEGLVRRVRRALADTPDATNHRAIIEAVRAEPDQALLDGVSLLRLGERLYDTLAGLGPLTELIADPAVTDVVVNGPTAVWVDRGAGLELVAGVRFAGESDLRQFAQRLVASGGRRLDDASPCADVALPGGIRLHAVLPPLAVRGPYLSLRTLRQQSLSLADLVRVGSLPVDAAYLIEAIVAARLAFVVTGGTGSGKTTMLAALLGLVPVGERIVVVEDATELAPHHPHVISLQSRHSNVEGAGSIGLRELVREALRMRPDRLVIGECRGAEVVDWLAALNVGHDGGAGTLHANGVAEVPARFETLGLLAGISRAALAAQLAAGLQVVLHLARYGPVRALSAVGLLRSGGPTVRAEIAWRRDGGRAPAAGHLAALLEARGVTVPAILSGQ